MEDDSRLSLVAEMIRDHISLDGIDRYLAETGVQSGDFMPVRPREFSGEIFAVDGSNASICNWSTANVNLIRAGYAVYQGRVWRRTVITFDGVFLADPKQCKNMFNPFLREFFGLDGVDLKESDLDRLSSYYRELQEYVAINDALGVAKPGDIILYDGSFDVFELLRDALVTIFDRAEQKSVALLAVAKSSSLFWGEEISLPFVQHTSIAGNLLLPGKAWYLSLKDKKVDAGQGRWSGQTYIVRFCGQSEHAFRVDAPSFLQGEMASVLGNLATYSCSSECLGYPHALFRAHRDIRITEQEGAAVRQRLMGELLEMGMPHSEIRMLMQDFHDILEMKLRWQ
jgi:hypothetical protein